MSIPHIFHGAQTRLFVYDLFLECRKVCRVSASNKPLDDVRRLQLVQDLQNEVVRNQTKYTSVTNLY